jgi:hypothetical protein
VEPELKGLVIHKDNVLSLKSFLDAEEAWNNRVSEFPFSQKGPVHPDRSRLNCFTKPDHTI